MPGKRILVIEDDELQREVIADLLVAEGYDVAMARNGEDGLAALRACRPDVLVLDLMMPRLDGATLLHEVRADPRLAGLPVIIATGVATPHVERLLRPQATLYKPFGPAELLSAVRALARA